MLTALGQSLKEVPDATCVAFAAAKD
jgi:hypothetical protein